MPQRLDLAAAVDGGAAVEVESGRQANIELDTERRGDLLGKVPPKRPVRRVHPAQQLAFVPADAEEVIAVAGAGRPQRPLERDGRRHKVEVGEISHGQRDVDHRQARLMRQQLPHGYLALAPPGELRPVGGDPLVVVQQAARMG